MSRMSLDTAIRLSAEVKGGANITKVQRSLQDLAKGSQTTARDMDALRTATAQYARASEGSIAGIRNSIVAFRGLQEQAKIGSREFTRYGAEVQRLERNLRGLEGTARKASPALNGLGAAAGRLFAAYAGIETVRFVFGNTAELEAQTRSLEVLTGSADRAKQIVQELQQLGAVTPFTSTELIDTAKRLQAFGVETEKVVDITRRLADVSGATGAELAGLATAYGQVQAKGRLQGEELLQFQERGVALQQVLREEYGLSGAEFQKALEGGKISAEAVEYALKKLTDTGGKYANGAIAQSDTLNGRLSTLSDSVQVLAQTIGNSLAPVFKWALTQATAVVSEIQRMIDEANNAGGARDREAQFARNADAAVRSMGLNPFTQQGTMADMRQRNIEQQRADYRLSQQGARATNAAPPSSAPPPLSGTGTAAAGSTGGGTAKAKPESIGAQVAKALAQAAEKMREQQQAAKDLLATEGNRLQLLQIADPLQKQVAESMVKQLTVMEEYGKRLAQSKSDEETKTLQKAQQNALQANGLELERSITDAREEALKPLNDAVQEYGNRLAYEQEYGGLLAKGINPELAKQYIEIDRIAEASRTSLELQIAKLEAMAAELPIADKLRKSLEDQVKLAREALGLIPAAATEAKGDAKATGEAQSKREKDQAEAEARAERLKELYKGISSTIEEGIIGSMQAGIDSLIDGSKRLDESLKEIASGVLKEISNVLLRFAINSASKALFPKLFADGGVFGAGGVTAFASGGIVDSPTLFKFAQGGAMQNGLMGEAGPEAIMPLRRGADGRLGVDASGMTVPYQASPAASSTGDLDVPYQASPAASSTGDLDVPYRSASAPGAASELTVPYQSSGAALSVPFLKTGGGDGGAASMPLDNEPIRYESVMIGSVEYVTKAEAEEIGKRSEQRTFKRLQNSPGARRAVGIR